MKKYNQNLVNNNNDLDLAMEIYNSMPDHSILVQWVIVCKTCERTLPFMFFVSPEGPDFSITNYVCDVCSHYRVKELLNEQLSWDVG